MNLRFVRLCNFLYSSHSLRKLQVLPPVLHISLFLPYPVILLTVQTEHFVTLDCQHYCHNVSFFFSFFFHLWSDFTSLHHRIALQSSGSLGYPLENSQFKHEASHNQEMPVVLARYQICAFPPWTAWLPLKIPHPYFTSQQTRHMCFTLAFKAVSSIYFIIL